MAINGMPYPKQRPFATETPILNPVYEPGPLLTATASSFNPFSFITFMQSSTYTPVSEACDGPSYDTFSQTTFPSRIKAAEQTFVDVSIVNIQAITISIKFLSS